MKRKIGILTSGGDCPGLNATIRAVAKACYEQFGEGIVSFLVLLKQSLGASVLLVNHLQHLAVNESVGLRRIWLDK